MFTIVVVGPKSSHVNEFSTLEQVKEYISQFLRNRMYKSNTLLKMFPYWVKGIQYIMFTDDVYKFIITGTNDIVCVENWNLP